jgi:hypothetical protein
MDLIIIKTASGLFAPYGEESQEACAGVKVGQLLQGKFTRMRHYEFHKKWWALMQLAFDIWSETAPTGLEYKGELVLPRLDNFRKDVTILAGWYTSHVSLKGEVRLEAKSISFSAMDQTEFEALYSQCINVILSRVLRPGAMTEAQLRERVEEVLRFDS